METKKLSQGFRNMFSYAAGMQQWVNRQLFNGPMEYTFAQDFAIADWMRGISGVQQTYSTVKKEWIGNYKAFTEVVIALNMMAWAHDQLKKQGYSGRDAFIELYTELYHKAVNDFYEKYTGDEEKCNYFFQMTD